MSMVGHVRAGRNVEQSRFILGIELRPPPAADSSVKARSSRPTARIEPKRLAGSRITFDVIMPPVCAQFAIGSVSGSIFSGDPPLRLRRSER